MLWELRSALRAGNVWVKHSRRYANPESYLIPQQQWITLRSEVCQLLQVPESGELRLQQLNTQLEAQLSRLDKVIIGSKLIRIEAGELIVSPLKASSYLKAVKLYNNC